MALVRYSPLREMMQLQTDVNRLFSGFFPTGTQEDVTASAWSPQVDVYEDADGIKVHADIPGVEQKDLEIQIVNNTLSIKGERRLANEEKKENYHRIERTYGSFSRSFLLPEYADTEKVDASFKNGVLEVSIPKKAEKKPKQINVQVK